MILKTIIKSFIVIASFFIVVAVPNSVSALEYEAISNFDSEVIINADSSIDVKETIKYDFGLYERQGIYREIPIKYNARGGNYNLRISDISVMDENDSTYNFEISYPGKNVNIKIGTAGKFIVGEHTYVLSYSIKRALNYFDEYDELYWNATGDEWNIPILNATSTIIFPESITEAELQSQCFVGYYGDDFTCDAIKNIKAGDGKISGTTFSTDNIDFYEGLTIAVGFPKGLVTPPSAFEKFSYYIKDNGILFLPLIVLGLMIYLWKVKGKDPDGRGTIIAQYEAPDKLTAAEVGTIIDERVNSKDISAQIIQFAVNGDLKIVKGDKKNDYSFIKLKGEAGLKNKFERDLFIALFGKDEEINLKDLKNKFYKDYAKITSELYKETVAKKYFSKNPKNVRLTYNVIGAITFFSGFLMGFMGAFYILAFISSGIIIMIFSLFMPSKTITGVHAREHILGLKSYLNVAEKDRLKFHNAPEKNPEHFDKLLPYAMVLGVEKEWASQFEDIYKDQPSWYQGPAGSNFNSLLLVNNLNSFQKSANSTMISKPSSSASSGGSSFSSGGFSGGGFGGGGGGSW